MNQKIKKGLMFFGIGFIALFIIGLVFELFIPKANKNDTQQLNNIQLSGKDGSIPYNIASSKVVMKDNASKPSVTVDQKYEQVAAMDSKTKNFVQDEKKLRDLILKFNALIQYEKKTGLEGRRYLDLAIGVNPKLFDEMHEAAKSIGELYSIQISKNDKTNEYKDLNAKKDSLQKTRASLLALKNKGGNIAEYISLENRILEIEEEIQRLGVRLGEYDAENEFCTIKFTLMEKGYEKGISVLSKIRIAFEWAVKYYIFFVFGLLCASLGSFLLIKIWEKLKVYF